MRELKKRESKGEREKEGEGERGRGREGERVREMKRKIERDSVTAVRELYVRTFSSF